MNRAILEVSPDLLVAALHLPADTDIISIKMNDTRPSIDILIQHKDLNETMPGCPYRRVQANFRVEYGERPEKIVFVGWSQ